MAHSLEAEKEIFSGFFFYVSFYVNVGPYPLLLLDRRSHLMTWSSQVAIAKRRERRSDAEPTFAPRNAVAADSRRSLDEGRLRKNETLAESGRRGRECHEKRTQFLLLCHTLLEMKLNILDILNNQYKNVLMSKWSFYRSLQSKVKQVILNVLK